MAANPFTTFAQQFSAYFGSPKPPTLLNTSSVVTGPTILESGQTIVRTTEFGGRTRTGAGESGSYWIPNRTTVSRPVSVAARTFYQAKPGEEITSFAPGAADLWRNLAAGTLPTLRLPGAERAVSDSAAGFSPGAVGGVAEGVGSGLPPIALLGIATGALVLLAVVLKKA